MSNQNDEIDPEGILGKPRLHGFVNDLLLSLKVLLVHVCLNIGEQMEIQDVITVINIHIKV